MEFESGLIGVLATMGKTGGNDFFKCITLFRTMST
jgi:hypothetical protein